MECLNAPELLKTMNSDFSQNAFVMLSEACLHTSIYIYPLFSKLVNNDMLLNMINSDFCQKSFVMLCEECSQISIYFLPLTLSNGVKRDVV